MKEVKPVAPIQSLVSTIIRPFNQFIELEESSGIILLSCSVLAMILANSGWHEHYLHFWEQHFIVGAGSVRLDKPLEFWINDGLMTIFFLAVGLEIKREFLEGELSEPKKALLPILAAVGGMVVPALIYTMFNGGKPSASGWAIPMATDIAFSLAILSLLGNRVPPALKVFLAALAIVDDLGAVLVIAIFYTAQLQLHYLAGAGMLWGLMLLLNRFNVKRLEIYLLLGVIMWYCTLESGIHATISGVLLAFAIPFRTRPADRQELLTMIDERLNEVKYEIRCNAEVTPRNISEELEAITFQVSSPAQRLEHNLHGYVAYLIMPLFALTNAGVAIDAQIVQHAVQPLSLGVLLGLLVGKPLGIAFLSWLSVKLRLASLPVGTGWRHVIGAGFLGGIGFTMSIFITLLAFRDHELQSLSKLSIVLASLISGIIGYLYLKYFTHRSAEI